MKLKTWKFNIKLFNWSWIMAFTDTLHIIIILLVKLKVVDFGLAHFQVLFYLFLFWGIYFSKSFDLSFRTFYPLFIFYCLLFSKYGKTTCRKQGIYIFTRLSKSIQNYESYIYRTLTMASHGDGISLWDVKNIVD